MALVAVENVHLCHDSTLDMSGVSMLMSVKKSSVRGNWVVDVSALDGLPNLTTLNLSDNWLAGAPYWTDLPSLETLYLEYNNLADLWPLAALPNLTWIDADHNQIFTLDAFVPVDDLCSPVRYLSVLDNALDVAGDGPVCAQIPAIRACGTEVNCEKTCPDPDNANFDANPFTNQDEWDYLSLFYAALDVNSGVYNEWIYLDDVNHRPPFTGQTPEEARAHLQAWLACVPKTPITVQIDGQGSVDGFDASYGAYHPSADAQDLWIRSFATYAHDCADACAANPACDYNTAALTASPANGWVFDYWWGDITPDIGNVQSPGLGARDAVVFHRNYNQSITVSMDIFLVTRAK